MPAQTNNTDILQAINQTVQALLDLAGQITGGGETTVNVAAPNVAVTVNCNCGGSGGQGPTTPPTDYTDDGETPPTGYPDYPTYNQAKCNASQWVVNTIAGDISWLLGVDIAGMTVAALGVGLLIPGIDLVAALGIFLFMASIGVFTSSLVSVQSWLSANSDDIRCAIYSAVSATEAKAAVIALIEASALSSTEQSVLKYFITQAAINKAFDFSNVPNLGADCSGCYGGVETEAIFGIIDWSNLGDYQNVNGPVDGSIAWGEFTVNNGATLKFTPDNTPYEGLPVVGCIVWSEQSEGGLTSISADGVTVSNGGPFAPGNPNGSYPQRYNFTGPVVADEFLLTIYTPNNNTPIYEVHFIVLT
jgi:hypothetical protein